MWTLVRQWRQKRVLMRPEAAFPYVSAAEGAQHPPKKPPRSTFRHPQHSATLNALPLRPLPAKPFSFAATKISIGRRSRCRYDRSRRNHSPLRQRKLESDADLLAATTTAGGPFLTAAAMTLHRFPSLGLKSRIIARKRAETGKTLHRFASLGMKSRIAARRRS